MKTSKRLFSLLLCVVIAVSTLCATCISASAASVSKSLGYDWPEDSGDYAYWSGSKVVKSSSTTKNEIKWMQKALNYCIEKEGLSATKLTIDGSFGPASKTATQKFQKAANLNQDGSFGPSTIKKMKSILDDNKNNSLLPKKNNITTNTNNNKSSKTLNVDMSIIKKTGYQPVSGPCGCYALAYCRDILDGKVHYWTEYSAEGYLKSKNRYGYSAGWNKAKYVAKTTSSKSTVYKALYDSINKGKPAVVRVKGNGSTGHYVAVVGYKNVTNTNSLNTSNFVIIDSASKTAFNRGITSMTSGSTGYQLTTKANSSLYQYAIPK